MIFNINNSSEIFQSKKFVIHGTVFIDINMWAYIFSNFDCISKKYLIIKFN